MTMAIWMKKRIRMESILEEATDMPSSLEITSKVITIGYLCPERHQCTYAESCWRDSDFMCHFRVPLYTANKLTEFFIIRGWVKPTSGAGKIFVYTPTLSYSLYLHRSILANANLTNSSSLKVKYVTQSTAVSSSTLLTACTPSGVIGFTSPGRWVS